VRRHPAVLTAALAAVLALTLAGCSSASGSANPSANPSTSSSSTVTPVDWTGDGVPTVTGGFGDKPTITFTSAKAPTTLMRKVLIQGNGPVVKSGELVGVDYFGQIYGGKEFDNSYDRHAAAGFQIGVQKVIAGWDDTIVGMKAGSRLLVSIPPALGYGSSGSQDGTIKGTDTLVFVIDIIDSFGPNAGAGAKATAVGRPPAGITVTGQTGADPKITIAKGTAKPAKPVTTVLDRGTGAPLPAGLTVVQYEAVDWTGATAGSSWKGGAPESATVTKGGNGPFDSLAGLPIGSRVLLLLPASGSGGPYAVVVDLVAHVPTAKQSLAD
jgi:peptidylprolyl isomerase